MKKLLATLLSAILGGACLCGNAAAVEAATYCDDGIMPLSSSTVTVNYSDKSNDTFRMALKHPAYASGPYLSCCACTAGANVIGFYDRYDENLIPNHSSGYSLLNQYVYSAEDEYVKDVIRQLYVDMGTDDNGTSITEFKDGMIAFCTRKNKSVSITSCFANKQFNYNATKNYMKLNRPVVFFCSGYNIASLSTSGNTDYINYMEFNGTHVMVGFGYQNVTYSLSSGGQALYEFIMVASGSTDSPSGLFDINYRTHIDDAFAINIT